MNCTNMMRLYIVVVCMYIAAANFGTEASDENEKNFAGKSNGIFRPIGKQISMAELQKTIAEDQKSFAEMKMELKGAQQRNTANTNYLNDFITNHTVMKRDDVFDQDYSPQNLKKEEDKLNRELLYVPSEEKTTEFYKNRLLECRIDKNSDNQKAWAKIGVLKNKVASLWLVRVRALIEKFEDDFGKEADVEFPTYAQENDKNVRKRIYRERVWNWIFTHKTNEYRVTDLKDKIIAARELRTTDFFSLLISHAHSDLSEYIHQYVMNPGSGDFTFLMTSTDRKVSSAIRIFMDTFYK